VTHGGGTMVAGLDLSRVHIMRTLEGQKALGVIPNAPQTLTYFGGNVLTTPAIFVVYWGFGKRGSDGAGEQTYLTNFFNGIGGSTWLSLDSQYYQNPGPVFIGNPSGQLKGTWVDSSSIPTHPTDAQIQAEAAKAVTHFGFNANASYVVATSHGHNTAGFGSSFCAYHGFTGSVSYTNLPYIHDAGLNCGENFINAGTAGKLDGVSIVGGHEYAESETDPNPPSGWYNNSYGEIGDICAWMKPPAGDITLSTGKFAVQGLWSNATSACKITGP
jgi:serine protease